MHARRRWSLLAVLPLMACRASAPAQAPSDPVAVAPSPPEFPSTIELSSEFTGDPVRVLPLDGGVVVELLDDGEGERAAESQLVVFEYTAHRAETGERMPGYKRRMLVGEETGNPIDAALQLVLEGQQPGMRARVFVPASFVDAEKPARAPAVGDVWLTVAIERVSDYPQIVKPDAFHGEPVATKVLDGGVEIQDYAPGHGPAASKGDLVEFVTIAESFGGRQILSNPYDVANMIPVADSLPSLALEGARVGMLRKYVVPRGYTSSPERPPLEVEIVHYLQITWIEPR